MNAREPMFKPVAKITAMTHQKFSLNKLALSKRMCDFSDPGTGKTYVEVMDFAIRRRKKGKCALVIATKSLLEAAWRSDFRKFAPDMKVSLAYAANREAAFAVDADVYVVNHDAAKWLAGKPKSFFKKFDTVVIDECFPAGTPVDTPAGPVAIEMLKHGDLVYTSSGALPISRTFAKESDALVQMELEDGTTITCTGNHPIATACGWVEARDTRGLSAVRVAFRQHDEQGSAVLQPAVRAGSDVGVEISRGEKSHPRENRVEADGSPVVEQRRSLPGRDKGQTQDHSYAVGSQAEDPRWQRPHSPLRKDDAGDAPPVLGIPGCSTDWKAEGGRLRHRVQGGFRVALQEVGTGGGREFAYVAKKLGCEERHIAGLTRVVRVSSVECAGPCMVYNLQVNGPHTYSVAGVLVHNCTAFKHNTSARSKSVAKIMQYFEYRRIMTGTPNGNGICDIWHQVFLVDDGKRLGTSFFKFRSSACLAVQAGPMPNMVRWEDRPGIENVVSALIADITIRHKFEDCVDIPENHKYALSFPLSKKHLATYNDMALFQVAQLKKTTVTAVNGAVVAGKLLQIASGAVYNDDGEYSLIDSERYTMVMDLVEARAHSIVFFTWTHQRDELEREAQRRGITYAVFDGSTSDRMRSSIVKDYQAGKYQVLLAHPQSAGHGLTLTKGTATIWASPTYNLEHFLQGLKRVHRIGQTEKTETIVVIAEGTIDEKVWESLQAKSIHMTDLLEGLL